MTENGKIFLTKNTIYKILSQQQFSIGLSLYIIKDIEKELQEGYNNILKQDLQEQEKQQKQKQQSQEQQEQKQQTIDFSNIGGYPVEWIPAEGEKENEDQVN